MLTIDGSAGEGGGQILRTALSLALVTGTSFRIESIRGKRRRPGLLRQHLTAVEAAAAVGGAQVEGASLGSPALTFRPGSVRSGRYAFSIGTAGSASLVLQTVLPALLTAGGPSEVRLEGGTHNPLAPPFEFLRDAYLPLLARAGARVGIDLERHGFYPAGGGSLRVSIEPAPRLEGFELLERGAAGERQATVLIAHLPDMIGQRELAVVKSRLSWPSESMTIRRIEGSRGPGNVLLLTIRSEHVTEIVTGFGQRQVRAEAVAEEAVQDARRYLASSAPVGVHLADQLVVILALAGAGAFRTHSPSRHLTTNLEVIRMFLDRTVTLDSDTEKTFLLSVR